MKKDSALSGLFFGDCFFKYFSKVVLAKIQSGDYKNQNNQHDVYADGEIRLIDELPCVKCRQSQSNGNIND